MQSTNEFTPQELDWLSNSGFSVNFADPDEVEYYKQLCRYGIYPPEKEPEIAFWKKQITRLQAEGYIDADMADMYLRGSVLPLSRITYGYAIQTVYGYLTDHELEDVNKPCCETCHQELDEDTGHYCPSYWAFDNFLAENKKHTPEDFISRIYDMKSMGLVPFRDVFPGMWKWIAAMMAGPVNK